MSELSNPWPLRLIALVIALLTWLFASYLPRVERLGESTVELELENVNLGYAAPPPGMVYRNNRSTIAVRLEGREARMTGLTADSVRITVPLPDPITPGTPSEVVLERSNFVVPEGIDVLSFSPTSVSVLIDELVEVALKVQADLRGEPGAGLTMDDVEWTARPDTVRVRGPRSVLEDMSFVATNAVNISGKAIDFSDQVGLSLPDPSMTATPSLVTIEVRLERDDGATETPEDSGASAP